MNVGPRTVFFALKKDVSAHFAVKQVVHILKTEKIQTLVKLERTDQEGQLIASALIDSEDLRGRVTIKVYLIV